MNERRRSTRRTNCLRGRLYFHGDGRNSLPCRILDASYEGARVIVDSPISVPDEVDLYIPKKKRIALASVRWRHGRQNRARAIRNQPPQRLVRTTKGSEGNPGACEDARGVMPTPVNPNAQSASHCRARSWA